MTLLAPASEQEAVDAIRAAKAPLRVIGADSKAGLGRSAPADTTLSARALCGVTLYEPGELVLSARAGTPLREIEALLAAQGQELAFEPMDYGPLLGGAPGAATIGGVVAVNACGPRRIKAGAARDHLLGLRCVTGRGDIVKSGGRVMKNVTGYDLCKLVCGSYGTLAVLTEVTLKVLPRAETERTLLFCGLDEAQSLALLRRAGATPCEVSSYAMLPKGAAPLRLATNAAALRLEGPELSLSARRDDLVARAGRAEARIETLDGDASRAFWAALRDAEPVWGAGQLWRVSVAPSAGFPLVDEVRRVGASLLAHFYDWAGGLVWLRFAPAHDANAGLLRAVVDALGGHATLLCADAATRSKVEVFHPQPPALAVLTRRVKDSFDPEHILERGRMRAEF